MRPSTTAHRYAEAAYQVASEDGTAEQWLSVLAQVATAVQQPDVAAFFRDPSVPHEQKVRAAGDMAPSGPQAVRNLLEMLAALERVHLVPAIVQDMRELDRAANGILEATVTVARPLSDAEKTDVSEKLGQSLGKRVEIQTLVDPSILGGIIVRVGDRLIDASVRGRLNRLRSELAT